MRFISQASKFGIQIVEERIHFTQYGDRVVDRLGYIAQFNQDDVTEADLELAARAFELRGMTTMIDQVTPTPLLERVSVFDTDEEAAKLGWDDAFKERVETFLHERAVNHPDFRELDRELLLPPWPNYLQFSGTLEQLVERVVEDGHSLAAVLAFERQTGRRPAVVEALEAKQAELQAAAQPDEVVLA